MSAARAEVTRRIKALGRAGRLREAIQQLASLAKLGIQPDTQAATALVSAAARAGDMATAQSIFDELFGGLLQPDEVTFSVLLRGYGAADPPAWTAIDATLSTMRNVHGLSPSATSFNALLEVCVRTDDLDRGLDVIERMAADGVEPDGFTEAAVAKKRVLRSHLRKIFA